MEVENILKLVQQEVNGLIIDIEMIKKNFNIKIVFKTLFFYYNLIMNFLKIIDKHTKLYNIDQEYTTSINQFLYENYKDFIINYESSTDLRLIDKQLKIEVNLDEINKQHQIELENLTNNYNNMINHFRLTHKEELNKIRNDTINLVSKEYEIKYINNISDLKINHANEINKLQKQIADLKSNSSIKLGSKAEQDLKELFIKLDKNCIDKHKTNHVADLWIIDKENKILYIIESKNKNKILSEDLIKFKYDLDYVTKNIKPNEFKDYEIIGLFISTRGDIINQEIGSFSFGLYETYISQQYITEEFFKLYFKSIETLIKLKISDVNYNNTLNLINGEYKNLRSLIDLCENINKNANIIISNSNKIKKEISIRVEDFKNKLINLNSPDVNKIEIEKQIKNYIKTNKNFTCKKVKEMSKGYNIFNGKQMTKKMLIEWAN